MHLPRSPLRRAATAWAAVAVTVVGGIAAPAAAAAPRHDAIVDPGLVAAIEAGQEATFFVVLDNDVNLSGASRLRGKERKAAAYQTLRAEAARKQSSLTRYLDQTKIGYESYWIANAVKVTGGRKLVERLAARPDVAALRQEQRYAIDTVAMGPVTTTETADPDWGVKDIGADQVWSQYADRGEGVVVANIDSGVQFNHPALAGNYRGSLGDGTYHHDYNWYDASGECPDSGTPCDNNGHGTHTMGTIAGAGGIGVAPGAKWVAVKGCEANYCTDTSLLKAGQWILAPTDQNGQNPRPDLAPDIVNNSWGGGNTTFYQDMIEAWNAAGIFEAFAAGNAGNGTTCSTTEAPGAQAPAYGVGAYDANGAIAYFSGFGPSLVDGSMKPNIAAPGVNVRSAWPGGGYRAISGTSMATPHVAGAVALLWSAAPSLVGDIDATRAVLNDSARDVDDTHCGGTADANNVWGEGKLDAFAAVDRAPHTAATITGAVTDRATGAGLAGITITATGQGGQRTVTTNASGAYRLVLAAGAYTVTSVSYGYHTVTENLTVTDAQALAHDIALDAVPRHAVTGAVYDVTGKPLPGASVRIVEAPPAPVVSDAAGAFRFPVVAEGSFTLVVTPAAPVLCNGTYQETLTVDGDESVPVRLPAHSDAFGNSCLPAAYSWVSGATKVALTGDENAKSVALPFPVTFYGVSALPATAQPNGILAAYWDDLVLDKRSAVKTAVTGTAGQRKFAIVWENATFAADSSRRVTFEAVFEEATGAIVLQYQSIDGASALEKGGSATVGIENQAGTDALQYSFNEPVLTDHSALRITLKAA